jgi:hypothetical protein
LDLLRFLLIFIQHPPSDSPDVYNSVKKTLQSILLFLD